jgi:hypothetical protein
VSQNLVEGGGGGVLVTAMPGRKVPEHCSGLHSSEKELLEWNSSAFCQKKNLVTLDFMNTSHT